MSGFSPKYAPLPDWFAISGMKHSSTYEAIGRGDLKAIKLGKRTLIDVESGLAWLATLPAARVAAPKHKLGATITRAPATTA